MKKEVGILNDFLPHQKKGQVTIFIIIAVLIIAIIAVFYFLRPSSTTTSEFDAENPGRFIQTCLEDKIERTIESVSLQGGSMMPENFISYQGEKIEYLCYTTEYYKTCVVQEPMLERHIESEITKEITSEVTNCFNELKSNYESRGYNVNLQQGQTKVDLLPKRIVTSFTHVLTTAKTETERHDAFKVVVNNNLYELVSIANSIIDFESEFGDADPGFYMSIYPDLKVEKLNQQDGSTIYILTDRNNGKTFQFASRSVAWPPGLGVGGVATN